jgi:transposase
MNSAANDSNSRERRHFTPEQKVAIVKRHLLEGVPISDLCDQCQIQPTQFYQWQKQLFDNAAAAFERKGKAAGPTPQERKIERLEAKLAAKNEVISELMEECVHLKKLDGAL